jgi:hypothetical protein
MMNNPWAPQRREQPEQARENIQDRLFRKFGPRTATGDKRPIRGQVQVLPDGMIGGRPIPAPATLMAPIRDTAMIPRPTTVLNKRRTFEERTVNAKRFLDKPKITLLQLDKPTALDAANRVRFKPARFDKPAPPVPWNGGYHRTRERDSDYPKSTAVSMQPIVTPGSRWQGTQFPISSVPSSATARLPKTL